MLASHGALVTRLAGALVRIAYFDVRSPRGWDAGSRAASRAPKAPCRASKRRATGPPQTRPSNGGVRRPSVCGGGWFSAMHYSPPAMLSQVMVEPRCPEPIVRRTALSLWWAIVQHQARPIQFGSASELAAYRQSKRPCRGKWCDLVGWLVAPANRCIRQKRTSAGASGAT